MLIHVSCAVRLVCIPPFVNVPFYPLSEQQRGGLHVGVAVHGKTVILDPYFC